MSNFSIMAMNIVIRKHKICVDEGRYGSVVYGEVISALLNYYNKYKKTATPKLVEDAKGEWPSVVFATISFMGEATSIHEKAELNRLYNTLND